MTKVLGTVVDITARSSAAERFRLAVEASPNGMVTIDRAGRMVTVNAAIEQQFGYRREELVGQPIEMLAPARRAADKVLAQMEGRYRGLLEAAPDAMVVVNQSGEIVLLNVQAEKQFGYRRDELLGQKVTNIIPDGFAERLIADDLRSEEDALGQQIGTGIELTARRKDGSAFPIEIMLSPLESAEGTLVTAAIRNISVRKAAEKVMAQMEGRYRGLLEAAPDAMVVVNQSGEIVLLNVQAEKQFGYRRDELLGQKVTNIIPVGFAERLLADDLRSAEDALAQQIGTGIELIGLRKDKNEFPIEIMLSPLWSAEETLVTAAIRDISVRKAAEEVLARLERLKDEFVSTVSHELRTPLTSISGSLGLLVGMWAGKLPESAARLLVIAHKNSQRLVRLINDILDIEKMESGAVTFDMRQVEVRRLVEQTIEANRGFAADYDVRIRLDPECEDVDVRADSDRLAQVVTNLLSNAIKFSPPGEEVVVGIEKRGETVRICVRDHGHGVPVEFRPRIFEKFAQADVTDARQKGGTGLGLSIVKQIVDRLGGEVGFDDAPGGGTIFHVDLPVWDNAVDQEANFEVAAGIPRILHLDDDHDVLAAVADALGTTAVVVSVDCIEDARHALADDRYDLAVLDISLGAASVMDFLPDLRNSQGDMIPAIIFAAHGTDIACDEQIGAALSKSQTSIESLVATIHGRLAHLARISDEAA